MDNIKLETLIWMNDWMTKNPNSPFNDRSVTIKLINLSLTITTQSLFLVVRSLTRMTAQLAVDSLVDPKSSIMLSLILNSVIVKEGKDAIYITF